MNCRIIVNCIAIKCYELTFSALVFVVRPPKIGAFVTCDSVTNSKQNETSSDSPKRGCHCTMFVNLTLRFEKK